MTDHTDIPSHSDSTDQDNSWFEFVKEIKNGKDISFKEQLKAYHSIFGNRKVEDGPPKVWIPGDYEKTSSNIAGLMNAKGFDNYKDLHKWSVNKRDEFWETVIELTGFNFSHNPEQIIDLSGGKDNPIWLPGATLNCVDNCFNAEADKVAIISGKENSSRLTRMTYGELERLVNRVSNGLINQGFSQGDRIAIYMPMTSLCIAAYLGIIKTGCQVVSIADSFSPAEIKNRMEISNAKAIITVNEYSRSGKIIKLYEKVKEAGIGAAIVIESDEENRKNDLELRQGDIFWHEFLSVNESFESITCAPDRVTNILFSSGTTGTPKAIPWNHITPLKCASDGYFHQDIHPGEVVAWPTNIGWMMGPWLIYATLINKASIALYEGTPAGEGFINFVEKSEVNVLGLIPSFVVAWRNLGLIKRSEWKSIRVFSSTGEPSNFEDYFWLMSQTDFRAPVIEYMGGTEIGGGYLTGTLVQPASPSTFTTPALGIDFLILDNTGNMAARGENGEVFLIPPSIGLSQLLLNADHYKVYYDNCPIDQNGNLLRRHGDQISRLFGEFYSAKGRVDDTMNLSGIKVSSVELEMVIGLHDTVVDCAAVSIQMEGESIEKLVVYVVVNKDISREKLLLDLSRLLSRSLNPLFKIHDLLICESLPKTASNKLMRRELRSQYIEKKD
ncbi:MAG: AMP-binding protein [Calditrichae bacterium]|nr:AMP-binding protein [Calditrichia bacterium]